MAGSDGERCNSAGTAKNGGTLPAPHAPLMISLVATLPALFIALFAAPFGLLADRVGRRLLLLIGLAIYGVLGVAPYWLNSLQWIVASRAGVFLLVILRGSRRGLAAMALTMGFVQLFDTVIGFVQHEPSKTYGPLLIATATFVSVRFLLRESESVLGTIGPVR
jgi:MFS family permease